MTARIPMTPEGQKILTEKLRYLKKVERPQNVQDIEIAREKGDLSENAEYDAAKNKQGHLNAQMKEIENTLALAEVIDPSSIKSDRIAFGATITLMDIDNDEELTYRIVGTVESDIKLGKISIESPIARALIGKEEADEVRVKTPKGMRIFEVVSIKYV